MVKELTKGKMTYKELSEWFGLNPRTLSTSTEKAKAKKMEILKTFADYHIEGKTIFIDEVRIPIYNKAYHAIKNNYEDFWGKHESEYCKKNKVDTCSNVADKILEKFPEVKAQIKFNTAKVYVSKAKVEDYGRTYRKGEIGKKGICESIWMNENGTRPLTDEEMEIFKNCARKVFESLNLDLIALYEEFKRGEITEEEYKRTKMNWELDDTYKEFMGEVSSALGYEPVRKTQLIKSAFAVSTK